MSSQPGRDQPSFEYAKDEMRSGVLRLRSMTRFGLTLLAASILSVSAQTTEPAIAPGGIVDAASYSGTVAPGSIAAVYGSFPLDSPAQASSVPLPTSLSQLSMQFGGSWRPSPPLSGDRLGAGACVAPGLP